MLRVLCVVLVLATPIFCGVIEGGRRKTAFNRIMDDIWREKCKNVTAITIDIDRNDQLYLDFKNCSENAVDKYELRQNAQSIFPNFDLTKEIKDFHISQHQKIALVAMSRKYCPKVDAFLDCRDILSPIHSECYDADELEGQRVDRGIYRGVKNFVCQNESDAVERIIDEKVMECAMEKKDEIIECYDAYQFSRVNVTMTIPVISIIVPKPGNLCRSIVSLGHCLVPPFNQCTFSTTAGDVVTSLFRNALAETSCNSVSGLDLGIFSNE